MNSWGKVVDVVIADMEAIKKQASKLREQVARQQQAILRQLGQLGHGGLMIEEADIEFHQQLQNLYKSTRAAKQSHLRSFLLHSISRGILFVD